MKIKMLLILILLCALCSVPSASLGLIHVQSFVPSSGGPSYIFQEDFEAPGFENAGWEVAEGGAYDDSFSTAPLVGSNSLLLTISDGTDVNVYHTLTETDPVYIYFVFKFYTLISTRLIKTYDSTFTNNVARLITNGTNLGAEINEGSTDYGSTTLSVGTTYHCWIEFQSGTPASLNVYLSTNATKPGTPECTVSANCTYKVGLIMPYLRGLGELTRTLFDKIRVDDVSIGSDPT